MLNASWMVNWVLPMAVMSGMFLANPCSTKVIYVDDDAPSAGDGTSWATAYRYLQDALGDAGASERPVEIRVAQGIYRPDQGEDVRAGDRQASFRLISGVAIKGGFAGSGQADPNRRDPTVYQSILSGDLQGNDIPILRTCQPNTVFCLLQPSSGRADNSYSVVVAWQTDATAILDGFVICGGHNDLLDPTWIREAIPIGCGGGMRVASGGCTIVNCTFCENSAGKGAGLYCEDAVVDLNGCVFQKNYGYRGGGLYCDHSRLSLSGCLVRDNEAALQGGGLYCQHSYVKAFGSKVSSNIAGNHGGGLANMAQGEVILANCLVVGNWSPFGGGISNYESKLELANCTFFGNMRDALAGIAYDRPTIAEIANCILWDSLPGIWWDPDACSMVSIRYSNVRGGQRSTAGGNADWGRGNMDTDPCFARPGYWDPNGTPDDPYDDIWVDGDYHLKSQAGRWDPASQAWVKDDVTSPCIDAGDPNSPIGLEPFPNGGRINMGAYGGTQEASKSYFGGPTCETIVAGYIDGNCKVDLHDLAILASHWLEGW